jgi:hypothetical protein
MTTSASRMRPPEATRYERATATSPAPMAPVRARCVFGIAGRLLFDR